jgi:hypothetical protein
VCAYAVIVSEDLTDVASKRLALPMALQMVSPGFITLITLLARIFDMVANHRFC